MSDHTLQGFLNRTSNGMNIVVVVVGDEKHDDVLRHDTRVAMGLCV